MSLPLQVDLPLDQAHDAGERAGAVEGVDVAAGHVGDGAQAVAGIEQDLSEVERGREFVADLVDQRHALCRAVEPAVQVRVGQRVGCDLGEALQQLEVGELARPVVEDRDDADDPAARDEGQLDLGAMPVRQVDLALVLRDGEVGRDVDGRDGTSLRHRLRDPVELVERIGGADELRVDDPALDTCHAAHRLPIDAVDVARRRLGGFAEAAGDALQQLRGVERRPELEPSLHEMGELQVHPLEAVEQQVGLQRPGEDIADAREEVTVHAEVPRPGVVDLEHAHHAGFAPERDGEVAGPGRLLVVPPLLVGQPGGIGCVHLEDLAPFQSSLGRREGGERRLVADAVRHRPPLLPARQAREDVALQPEGLASRSIRDLGDLAADGVEETLETAPHGLPPELDERRLQPPAHDDLVVELGVAERCRKDLADALEEVDVVCVVARPVVEHLDEPDDFVVGDQGDAELALEAPIGVDLALALRQPRVLRASDDGGLAGLDGGAHHREAVERRRGADRLVVQAAFVDADDAAQNVAFQPEHVAVGCSDRGPQPLGDHGHGLAQVP